MERYCGWVKRSAVRSRKHALASIDNRILETTQLEMTKMRYGLTKKLSLKPQRGHTSKDKFPDCKSTWLSKLFASQPYPTDPGYALLDPKRALTVDSVLERQLVDLIVTRFSPNSAERKIPTETARKYVPSQLTEWGRVQIYDTGDRARGQAYHKPESSTRVSSFVRVRYFQFI